MGSPDRLIPYWCCKRDRKKKRGSQTPGKIKSQRRFNPPAIIRTLANRNRAYKRQDYGLFLQRIREFNDLRGLKGI